MIFVIIFICLLFSALFSGSETGYYSINKVKLYYRLENGDKKAKRLHRVMRDSQIFIFTILIGNNLAIYIASEEMTKFFTQTYGSNTDFIWGFIPWSAETMATLALLLPFFFIGELFPKTLFRHKSHILYFLTPVIRVIIFLFYPISVVLKKLVQKLVGESKDFGSELENISVHGLKYFIDSSHKEGAISESQNKIINNLIGLNKTKIEEIGYSSDELPMLDEQSSVVDALKLMKKTRQNYVAVSRDGELYGIANFFAIMNAKKEDKTIKDIVVKIPTFNLKYDVYKVFYQMQKNDYTIAKITDRRRRMVGVLHLKELTKLITK